MSARLVVLLASLLLLPLVAPEADAAAGSQTIYYVKHQAYVQLEREFLDGSSGFGCWSQPTTDDVLSGDAGRVLASTSVADDCGWFFRFPAAQTGAVAILELQDQDWFTTVGFHWRLVDGTGAVCSEGDASSDVGDAFASFTVLEGCRRVEFNASDGVTYGVVKLAWSA